MELVLILGGQIITAAAIWGGIRADIRHLMDSTERAHERIDAILERKPA